MSASPTIGEVRIVFPSANLPVRSFQTVPHAKRTTSSSTATRIKNHWSRTASKRLPISPIRLFRKALLNLEIEASSDAAFWIAISKRKDVSHRV